MSVLTSAAFVASVAALIYGYTRNNRNIMLAAALALFLSAGLGEFVEDVRDARQDFQAGFREGWEAAAPRAPSEASRAQGK